MASAQSKDEDFLLLCLALTRLSKNPEVSEGACVVDKTGKILGIGYTDIPKGYSPEKLTQDCEVPSKSLYVCHAAQNAIAASKGGITADGTIYTTLFPCCECAKLIVQAGITRLVYWKNKYKEEAEFRVAERILKHLESRGEFSMQQSPDDQLLIAFCKLEAQKSIKTIKIGSCVVDSKGNLLGLGSNNTPSGAHAEINAITNGIEKGNIQGGKIYSTSLPCSQCAEQIFENGIKEVVYLDDECENKCGYKDSKTIFEVGEVKHWKFLQS